jgi:hypothetical protein
LISAAVRARAACARCSGACSSASCAASLPAFSTDATRCSVAAARSTSSTTWATGTIGSSVVKALIRPGGRSRRSTPALAARTGLGPASGAVTAASAGGVEPGSSAVTVPVATAPTAAAVAMT